MSLLEFSDVSFHYPSSQRHLIENLSFKVCYGEKIALLGQNGTGKSTLFKLALGLLKPLKGHILIDGQPVTSSLQALSSKVIALNQRVDQSLFMDLSVIENLTLWKHRFKINQPAEVLFQSLSAYDRLYDQKLQKVRHLSGGEQQLLLSSLIFSAPPQLLFLDEHTSQLDPHMSESIMRDLLQQAQKHKTTVLMITHDLEEALSYADRIFILRYKNSILEYRKSDLPSLAELKKALI